MPRLSKKQKEEQAKLEAKRARNKVYKYWHDQYRRNPKYAEWTKDKCSKALARRMKKYDKELEFA